MQQTSLRNQVQLITYPDSLGGNLKTLKEVLDTYLADVIGGVHILPFYPSSADRGFAPLTHLSVDPQFGSWADIQAIAAEYDLVADLTVNHLSCASPYFQDFLEKSGQDVLLPSLVAYYSYLLAEQQLSESTARTYVSTVRARYEQLINDGTLTKRLLEHYRDEPSEIDQALRVFENLEYISSAGLSVLLMTQKRLAGDGHELKLVNLSNHISDVFRYAGFDLIFSIE